jgi:hypothetical protein
MYTFGQLRVGDLFNTKSARWVKTTSTYAVCVMSGTNPIGQQCPFKLSDEVVVLWSHNQQIYAACTELLENANQAQHAAAFRQSLIDERDALIARRDGLRKCVESGEYRPGESVLLAAQDMAMADYIIALGNRILLS